MTEAPLPQAIAIAHQRLDEAGVGSDEQCQTNFMLKGVPMTPIHESNAQERCVSLKAGHGECLE
jgi:hypothetical protein